RAECQSGAAPVLIVTPSNTSPLIDEGVVRVRGELSALGLTTENESEGKSSTTSARPAYQGTLVFERFGDWLRIQAWNPNLAMPVTQWIDTSDPSVDAEVLAVRAVEALRAALLPYLRRPPEPKESPAPATPSPASTRPSSSTGVPGALPSSVPVPGPA